MNNLAREKLVAAALAGVKQIKYQFTDLRRTGFCALGVLGYNSYDMKNMHDIDKKYGLDTQSPQCLFMGTQEETDKCKDLGYPGNKYILRHLVAHLNDMHGMSFLDIARKFPEIETP